MPLIREIKIRNKGIIQKADIRFKNGLNIIKGKNATGKTTALEVIESRFKSVRLDKLSAGERMMLMCLGLSILPAKDCILVDDINMLNKESLELVLSAFSGSKNQIILTLQDHIKIPKLKANIIDTKDFELKQG